MASALDAAHAEGLVHRDVKPGNILVDLATGVSGLDRAYLSDFGISKRTTSRGGLTRTGHFVGTVDYVAPEQITGEPVDGRADVYSLGCVLFRCLCGRVPFPGMTEVATIYSHLHDPPPSLLGAIDAWAGVDRVLAKALAKDKRERYDTCGALVEATRTELIPAASTLAVERPASAAGRAAASATGVKAARPVRDVETVRREVPGPDSAPPTRPGRLRRRPIALFAGAAAVVAAVAVLALVLPQLDDASDNTPRSPTEPTGPTGPTAPPVRERVQLSWNEAYPLESVFGGSGKQAILDAVVTDDAVFAVGHAEGVSSGLDDAAVWRSMNGRRWNVTGADALSADGDQRMIAVTEFQDAVVAAGWDGSDAAVWVSRDEGETWTPSSSPALGGFGTQLIRDLVPSGSVLIAVGKTSGPAGEQDAAAWISDDGLVWERMAGDAFAAAGQQEMWSVRPLGSRLVVIGYTTERGDLDPAVWLYEDGTWSRIDADMFAAPGSQIMLDVAGGGRGLPLVAVGCDDPLERCDTVSSSEADAAVWTSDDGRSWERVAVEGRLGGDGVQVMRAIVTFRGSFVAVGTRSARGGDLDGAVWITSDGLVWRAPGPLDPTTAQLGGAENQSLRALVAYRRGGITLLGFGVTDEGEVEDAQVWSAFALGR